MSTGGSVGGGVGVGVGDGPGPGVVETQYSPVGVTVFVGSGVEKLYASLLTTHISPVSPGFNPVNVT